MTTRFRWGKIALLALLGVGLVLNPTYFYPAGGDSPEITYRVAEVSNESTAQQAIGLDERVLDCPVERPCALEERILEDGAIQYNGRIQDDQSYPVVRIGEDTYLPRNEVENRTTRLTLEEVSPQEAVAHAAVPADELRPEVRTAVETGSVTVYGEEIEAFERGWIVEYEGEYYYRNGVRLSPTPWTNDFALPLVRGVMFAVGVASLLYAGWTARNVSDRTN